MKRGIVMSFSMIAVLASILFIAVSLRQISDTYQSSDNSALDHAAFVKSTMIAIIYGLLITNSRLKTYIITMMMYHR